MSKNILVISTYPIDNPQHGGQKRVAAIVEEYERAGNTVRHLAIYMDYFYPNTPGENIAIPWAQYHNKPAATLVSDLMLIDILQADSAAGDKFKHIVKEFAPDVVQVEQGFLYQTVKDSLGELGWSGAMVNSTHNVEADLKRQILIAIGGLEKKAVDEIVGQISSLEKQNAVDADWTIACTEADARAMREMGAKTVIVSPNGIGRSAVDDQEKAKWTEKFARDGVKKVILYVGSAHPPNLTGYRDMIGDKVAFIDDDTRLVVVGGVADMINHYGQSLPNYSKELFYDHLLLLGRVEENTLTALLAIADQIILPINEGSGSNLKTAEAILWDKLVVGTKKAFNSYESYLDLPNIVVADTGIEFRMAMDEQLRNKKVTRSADQKRQAEGVLWKNALKLMVEGVAS